MIHVRLGEWQTRGPRDLATPELQGAALDGPDARMLAERLAKLGVLEVVELRDGIHVRAFAHVGRVQIGNLVVTVDPKIGAGELLALLRYAYGLGNLSLLDETKFATTGTLLQDLVVAQLVAEVAALAARGLSRAYVARAEVLPLPRGRIDMSQLAGRWPLTDARLPCRHHQRSSDHLLNRALLAGLRLAADVAQDLALKQAARRWAARLAEEISDVRLDAHLLERARRRLDRLTSAYESALRTVELLFACRAISMDGESTTELRGFLFDMNRFFQALMGRFLTEHLEGFDVGQEHALRRMMSYVPGWNPRRKRPPTPRPDFVVKGEGRVVGLLDAKYRDLWVHELPRDMLYQLAMYALSQARPATAAILFPTVASNATDAVIEIRDPVRDGALGYVALRPVDLRELLSAISEPGDASALARRYAFGEAHSDVARVAAG